jgi:hypothetical protein
VIPLPLIVGIVVALAWVFATQQPIIPVVGGVQELFA